MLKLQRTDVACMKYASPKIIAETIYGLTPVAKVMVYTFAKELLMLRDGSGIHVHGADLDARELCIFRKMQAPGYNKFLFFLYFLFSRLAYCDFISKIYVVSRCKISIYFKNIFCRFC